MPDGAAIAELSNAVRDLAGRIDGQTWPRWLDVATAARYCSLGEKSVRNLVANGSIHPSRTVRGKLLIDRHELDGALTAGCGRQLRKGRGIRN